VPGEMTQGSVPVPDPTKLTTDAVDRAIRDLKELFDTRIDGIVSLLENRIALLEKGRQEADRASEKAIDKAEAAMVKQIEQMRMAFESAEHNLAERLSRIEGRVDGGLTQRTEGRASTTLVVGLVALAVSIAIGGITLIALLVTH